MTTSLRFSFGLTCSLLVSGRPAVAQEPTERSAYDARLDAELAQSGGLKADDVVARALETSFDVRAKRAELFAAAADVDRALLGYLPELTVSASYTRLSDVGAVDLGNVVAAPGEPPGALAPTAQLFNVPLRLEQILNQYALQASLLVPVSDYFLRVAPARSAAEHAKFAASFGVDTARARVATDARVAYYSWVRARLSVVVAEQALLDAQAHLADTNALAGAGAALQADVLRVESQVARSELLVVTTKTLAAVAEEQLRAQLHDDSSLPLTIGEDIRQAPADRSSSSEASKLPELQRAALRARPELKAIEQDAQSLVARARTDRAGLAPRLDALAGAAYADPNPRIFPPKDEFRSSWQAGVRLSWSLTDVPVAGLRAKAEDARAAAARSERSLLMDRIRVEVRAAAQSVDDAAVALNTTQRGLDAAEESYRARRLAFQNGKATNVEQLDAETDLTRTRLERLNAEVDARVARARLDFAIGGAVPPPRR